MHSARGITALLLLAAFRLARCWIALLGLAQLLGDAWAALVVLIAVLAGCNGLLRLAAFIALLRLWHWPWPLAALFAAPRLLLVLPGLVTTAVARWRHPRPLWTAFSAAALAPTAIDIEPRPLEPGS